MSKLAAVAGLALALIALDTRAQDESSTPGQAAARFDAALGRARRPTPIFVRMADQLFAEGGAYEAFCARNPTAPRSKLRTATLAVLAARADRSFESARAVVDELAERGELRDVQRYWIVNGFAADANAEAVRKLAGLEVVAYVHEQTQPGLPQHRTMTRDARWLAERGKDEARALALLEARDEEGEPDFEGVAVPWNLERIRAPQAWKTRAFGQGVVVALLDTGVIVTPPLVQALWRNANEKLDGTDTDGNGYVDDLLGWDFGGDTRFVVGDGPRSHGTICGGIVAGRPAGEPRTLSGVAPRAQLMVLRGMGTLRAYEYAATMGADVMSMSYMWVGRDLGSYRGIFRTAHEHLAACGIVAVGGAGNFAQSAPAGRQIAVPKDIPCVIAAAGVLEDNLAPAFSSRGPCTWDDVPFFLDHPPDKPLAKPDVTGCCGGFPVWHWTTFPSGRAKVALDLGDGTGLIVGPRGNSFAGPHAAGVAALMLSANPELTPWRVKELMEATCRDLGEKGRDTTYGAGLLDAGAAVATARTAVVD